MLLKKALTPMAHFFPTGNSTDSCETNRQRALTSRGNSRRGSFGMESGNFLKQTDTIEQYFTYFLLPNHQQEILVEAFVDMLITPYFVEETNKRSSNYHIMSGFLRILKSASLDPLSWLDMIAKRKGQETFVQLTFIEFEEELFDLMKIMHQELFDHYHLQALFQYLTNRSENNNNNINNTTANNSNISGNIILKRYHVYAAWKKFTTKTSKIKSLNAAAKFLSKFHPILEKTKTSLPQLLPFLSKNTVIRVNELSSIIETLMIKIQELELLENQPVVVKPSQSLSILPTIKQQASNDSLNGKCETNKPFLTKQVSFSTSSSTNNLTKLKANNDSNSNNNPDKPMNFGVNEEFARYLYDHERKALNHLVESLAEGEKKAAKASSRSSVAMASRSSMIMPCRASVCFANPTPSSHNNNASLPTIHGMKKQLSKKRLSMYVGSMDEYELTEASGRYFPPTEPLQHQCDPLKTSTEGLNLTNSSAEPLVRSNSTAPTNIKGSRMPKLNDFLETSDFRLGYARSRLNKIW